MKTHYCKEMDKIKDEDFILEFYVDSWQLGVLSDHEDSYGYVYIKYCPFCGVKL